MMCLKAEFGKTECPYLTGDGIEKCYACNNDCVQALSEGLASAEKALNDANERLRVYRAAWEQLVAFFAVVAMPLEEAK